MDKLELFKIDLTKHLQELQKLVVTMPYRGNSCVDSQKICLNDKLASLEMTINGIREEDLNK